MKLLAIQVNQIKASLGIDYFQTIFDKKSKISRFTLPFKKSGFKKAHIYSVPFSAKELLMSQWKEIRIEKQTQYCTLFAGLKAHTGLVLFMFVIFSILL